MQSVEERNLHENILGSSAKVERDLLKQAKFCKSFGDKV